jgi:hypothetical protein
MEGMNMDAKKLIKKQRDYCNSLNDCKGCRIKPFCSMFGTASDVQIDELISFFEPKQSTCPTCGAPVEECHGETKYVPKKIDAENVANVIVLKYNSLSGFVDSWQNDLKNIVKQAIEEEQQ